MRPAKAALPRCLAVMMLVAAAACGPGACGGPLDAGPDAGDGGASSDGGEDAGPLDAGRDGGAHRPDGGHLDAGAPTDAGLDGGGGVDGGGDGGVVDAGPPCPVPVMAPLPMDSTSFTVLSLDATGSTARPPSEVVGWQWTVAPPRLLAIPLNPSPAAEVATYELSVSGTYAIELAVTDSEGRESCSPAQRFVTVVPQHDLQVELTWTTPGDPELTDIFGADLDVHLLLPLASRADSNGNGVVDGYFSVPFDVHWLNVHYTHFTPELEDDVRLHFDDTNGAGPEVIAGALQPELGYRVGIHCFNDHGFGPSDVHVDVWVGGIKAVSIDRTLSHQQFWDVVELVPAGPQLLDQVVSGITDAP